MKYKLSILIPSIAIRHKLRTRILNVLNPQIYKGVELLIDIDNGEIPVGIKLQGMVERARGEYVACIGDDDMVPDNYVKLILNAIKKNPDVVGIIMNHYINGEYTGKTIRSIKYNEWGGIKDPDNPEHHISHSSPHTINPTKRELVLKVKFCDMIRGSDKQYSLDLLPFLKGKTEEFITQPIYYYLIEKNEGGHRINVW